MSRRRGNPEVDGVLVVDKPSGMSSYDVIRRLKRLLGTSRLGHTGTLDPMATGVLVVCAGWSTRLVPFLSDGWKVYEGTIALGTRTDTDDAEGAVVSERPVDVTEAQVDVAMRELTGSVRQVPPAYSALKIDGERAYAAARRGDDVDLAPRTVDVRRFARTGFDGHNVLFDAEVSKGTYIRSLARDLGEALGCGAHLSALRRTANAPFDISDAVLLDEGIGPEALRSPWSALAMLPAESVSDADAEALRQGRALVATPGPSGLVRVSRLASPEDLVAICERAAPDGSLRPIRVRPAVARA